MISFPGRPLSLAILLVVSLVAPLAAVDEKSFADLKAETRAKFEKEMGDSAKKIEVGALKIESKPADGETQDFPLSEGGLRVPKPSEVKDRADRGRWDLKYPGELRVLIFKKTTGQRHQFDQLPKAWGEDDFEKILKLSGVSLDDIDQAKTPEELAESVVELSAKGALTGGNMANRISRIDSPQWEGILWGDMEKKGAMGLSARVKGRPDTTLFVQFYCKEKSTPQQVIDYPEKILWVAPAEKEEGK